jgi:alkanesulfonate monooxygenase SsuD/methylene tetrahydromethanopterin reductase-like flavin-dependent oxidoreductase (luciferase family)
MKFALNLPNAGAAGRLVDIAVSAEANGWDGVFLWDHIHLFREMRLDLHDPWVLLGAIAARTSRIRIGTMVTPLPRRRPQKYAKEVVTLDHLSGGRVTCGVGLGFPPEDEFTAFGEPAGDRARADVLDEALELVTALWTASPVDHVGSHFEVHAELHPGPVQTPRPPIWVAALWPNPRPLRRAARYEGVFPIGSDGGPIGLDELRRVAEAVPPGIDVVGSWMPGGFVADYADAGVTWLVDSRWPDEQWLEELEESAARDPRTAE